MLVQKEQPVFYLKQATPKWIQMAGILMILALLLGLPLLLKDFGSAPASAAPPQVGMGLPAQNALEFVGRIDQNGPNFTGYGYFTFIRDLNSTQLFTNPALASESTARFTFYATAVMDARAVVSDVFVINSLGDMTFYFDPSPPGRSFGNPASFTSGTPIATASMRYHDTLLVQAPNKGLASGVAEVIQETATAFSLGGSSYTLGAPDLFYRFTTIGNATRTDPNPSNPVSFVLLSGHAVTGGQSSYLPLINRSGP